jgi:hypothetical protein
MTSAAAVNELPVPSRPRLVLFCSRTSGHRRRIEGYLAQVLQHHGNHDTFMFHKIIPEQRPDLHERFHVTAAPVLVVIQERRSGDASTTPTEPGRQSEPRRRQHVGDVTRADKADEGRREANRRTRETRRELKSPFGAAALVGVVVVSVGI